MNDAGREAKQPRNSRGATNSSLSDEAVAAVAAAPGGDKNPVPTAVSTIGDGEPDNNNNNNKSPSEAVPTSGSNSSDNPSFGSKFVDESLWPGMGLLGEAYMLFSVGTLKPIWEALFPDNLHDQIPLTYSVVLGVISGMLLLGYLANQIGRRLGSIATASLMTTGAVGLMAGAFLFTDYPVALFRIMTASFFIFGLGVGGEYPLAAASASERAMGDLRDRLEQEEGDGLLSALPEGEDNVKDVCDTKKRHGGLLSRKSKKNRVQAQRGQHILLVFCMQGVGIFVNCLVMTALLMITGQSQWIITHGQAEENFDNNESSYALSNQAALLSIWRTTYSIGSFILLSVLYYRINFLKESLVWQDDKQRRQKLARSACIDCSSSPVIQEVLGQPRRDSESPSTASIISRVSSVSSLSTPSIVIRHIEDHYMHDDSLDNLDDFDVARHYYNLQQDIAATDSADDLRADSWTLLWRNYGVRLVGVSLCWLLWDVSFYGNKLFQSTFILALTGEETTLLEFSLAATLNAAVAFLGYCGAALLVDRVGRRRLQQFGFLLTGALFVGCGFLYEHISTVSLVVMYLGSSFFGQLGPNATTFLIPTEIFPTEVRTFCHGVAAASGKVGALLAVVAFNYLREIDMFLVSGYAAFAAFAVTYWTIPETLGLDLYEIDRKWRMTLDGRKSEYKGDANHPRYMSFYERNEWNLQQRDRSTHHVDHFHAMDI